MGAVALALLTAAAYLAIVLSRLEMRYFLYLFLGWGTCTALIGFAWAMISLGGKEPGVWVLGILPAHFFALLGLPVLVGGLLHRGLTRYLPHYLVVAALFIPVIYSMAGLVMLTRPHVAALF